MRYVEARLTEKTHALMYRIYVTDTLQCIANEIKVLFSKSGDYAIKKRYYDFYKEVNKPGKEETRTGDEIIADLKGKLEGLKK